MVDTEGPTGLTLGLEVRELLDRDAELLAKGRLRPRRIARDAVERRAARGELAADFVIEAHLIGADGTEGKRIEDQHRRLTREVLAGELAAFGAGQRELRSGCPGLDHALPQGVPDEPPSMHGCMPLTCAGRARERARDNAPGSSAADN